MKKKCQTCPYLSLLDPKILNEIYENIQEIKVWVRLYALNQKNSGEPDLKGVINTLAKINGVLTLLATSNQKQTREE